MFAASAYAFGEIRYADRPLNLRNARSAKSSWVGSLYPGQKVRVAFLKDGWVAVFEPGETRSSESAAVGYSNAKYLKKKRTRHEPKAWGELVYTARKLNIRSKPSVQGQKLGQLGVMEHVRIDFPEDDWTMVFAPDATIRSEMNAKGYCSAKYFEPATEQSLVRAGLGTPAKAVHEAPSVATVEALPVNNGLDEIGGDVASVPVKPDSVAAPEKSKATAPTVVSEPSKSTGSWGAVVTVQHKVNLRKERTSSSRYVRTLKPGERVRVDFLKNGWYAVFRADELVRKENRAIGYALRSLIEGDNAANAMPEAKGLTASSTVRPQKIQDSVGGVKKTMVIDRSKLGSTKRPDPTPDKTAHGYQYRLLEKSETKRFGESWITLKVFLSTKQLPGSDALKDFATTLWKQNKRATKNLAVLIYLPGMDTEDLSYGVIQFDDSQMLEVWVRKATLFGTDFL